jgi:hypothetical protein
MVYFCVTNFFEYRIQRGKIFVNNFSYLELFDRVNTPTSQQVDKEELWQKAMMGLPLTEEKFDRM